MTKKDLTIAVDKALANVDNERRGFLKTLLLGSAAVVALPLLKSNALAQDAPPADPNAPKKKKKKAPDDGAPPARQ